MVSADYLPAPWFAVALFALGFGWNLSMVGGSVTLVRDLPGTDPLRVQGKVEGWVWGAAAFAALTSAPIQRPRTG
jgi:hypothetical protein